MLLNIIFAAFFIIGFLTALIRFIFGDSPADAEIFSYMTKETFDMFNTAFKIALYLTGGMCFWLGIMQVGEKAGIIALFARILKPFMRRLFPDLPENHPAHGAMLMNISANMLGLDNAATPLGLKAMRELQSVNSDKKTASNAQIMFIALNSSGLTLIPVSIIIYRTSLGSEQPASVFLPILLATSCSTLAALFIVGFKQRLQLFSPPLLALYALLVGLGAGAYFASQSLSKEKMAEFINNFGNICIFLIIVGFIVAALLRKVNVYENFIEGAKDGFKVATDIIPYLVAILSAIIVFRSSGAMSYLIDAVKSLVVKFDLPAGIADALPTAIMKPLSGSGARGMMLDAMKEHGADSFIGMLSSCFQGSTETTFYVIAVYFGAIGVRRTRYALPACLGADICGAIAAIIVCVIFFA